MCSHSPNFCCVKTGVVSWLDVHSYMGIPWRLDDLRSLVGTSSVWTIDLAALLRSAAPQLRFLFCTAALGASDGHADLDMYAREFESDAVRVEQLFRRARRLRIPYALRSLARHDLRALLRSKRVAVIVLVDLYVLRPPSALLAPLRHLAPRGGTGLYAGHYVLLTGVSGGGAEPDTFYYLDPGQASGLRAVGGDTLDAARLATGTDEDAVIVEVPRRPHAHAPRAAYDAHFAAAISGSVCSSHAGPSLGAADAPLTARPSALDALWKAIGGTIGSAIGGTVGVTVGGTVGAGGGGDEGGGGGGLKAL